MIDTNINIHINSELILCDLHARKVERICKLASCYPDIFLCELCLPRHEQHKQCWVEVDKLIKYVKPDTKKEVSTVFKTLLETIEEEDQALIADNLKKVDTLCENLTSCVYESYESLFQTEVKDTAHHLLKRQRIAEKSLDNAYESLFESNSEDQNDVNADIMNYIQSFRELNETHLLMAKSLSNKKDSRNIQTQSTKNSNDDEAIKCIGNKIISEATLRVEDFIADQKAIAMSATSRFLSQDVDAPIDVLPSTRNTTPKSNTFLSSNTQNLDKLLQNPLSSQKHSRNSDSEHFKTPERIIREKSRTAQIITYNQIDEVAEKRLRFSEISSINRDLEPDVIHELDDLMFQDSKYDFNNHDVELMLETTTKINKSLSKSPDKSKPANKDVTSQFIKSHQAQIEEPPASVVADKELVQNANVMQLLLCTSKASYD